MTLITVVLLTGLLTIFSVVRTPSFQRLAGKIAADFLSQEFNTPVYINTFRISGIRDVRLGGVKVMDYNGQPMLELGALHVKLQEFSLKQHEIGFRFIRLVDGGFFLRRYENDSLLNLNYFLQNFQAGESDTVPFPVWKLSCESLILDEFAFGFRNELQEQTVEGVDFNDLYISEIIMHLTDISVVGDSISAIVAHLSFMEKSGLTVRHFSGITQVSSTGIRLEQLNLETPSTSLDMDLAFLYDNYNKLGFFLDSVRITAGIRSSLLTLSDIGYFAPDLLPLTEPLMLEGMLEGTVSDFSTSDFRFKTGDFTEFIGDISMKGLPDVRNTFVSLDIQRLRTTPDEVSKFHLPVDRQLAEYPDLVNDLGITTISGKISGFIDDFNARLALTSDLGKLQFSGSLSGRDMQREITYFGEVLGSGLRLDRMTGNHDLGTADLDLEFEGEGITLQDLNIVLSGWVENLVYKSYRYDKLIIGGVVRSRSYNGRLLVIDPSLSFSFDGLVDFNQEIPHLDFSLELLRARFFDMNLSDKSEDMNLQGTIKADFEGIDPDNFHGLIRIDSMKYTEHGNDYFLRHLELNRIRGEDVTDEITLRSDYIDADLIGTFKVQDLIGQVRHFLVGSEEEDILADRARIENPQQLSYDLRLKDTQPLTEIFMPNLEISPGAAIKGKFDSYGPMLTVEGHTEWIIVSGITFNEVSFSGQTIDQQFHFEGDAGQIVLMEQQDTVSLSLDHFNLNAVAGVDSISFSILWDNYDSVMTNQAAIDGFFRFPSSRRIEAGIYDARANFNGEIWQIREPNLFVADSGFYSIEHFHISKGKEVFYLDGAISYDPADTINLVFKDWSLSNFNPLLAGNALEFDGMINGSFGMFISDSIPNIFTAMTIADFVFNDVYFGDADIQTRWNDTDTSVTVNVSIFDKSELADTYKILDISGSYFPFHETRNFDLTIATRNLNISVMKPMLTGFSSNIAGFATGKLDLRGTIAEPLLTGSLKLQRAEMKIDYLNVNYSFANEVIFEENLIYFDRLTVYDPNSNQAVLKGGIRHEHFRDFQIDLSIEPDKFLGFDLNRYQNEIFYGQAIASGIVKLTGPLENINILTDVKTEKGTRVTIPVRYSVDVSQGDFIVFTNQADTLVESLPDAPQVTGINLDISMQVTNAANIEIILPGSLGFIKANGQGNLRLGVDPNGYLTMDGSYTISSGLFTFSLEQLLYRRFEIIEGSRIIWTGDINDAEVNITARYRVRTSLDGLGIGMLDSDAAGQRVVVYTDIRMTGNLFNPDLNFMISFPGLQEQYKQAVYAVLDTNDFSMMSQQAISLLVLSSFSNAGIGGTGQISAFSVFSNSLSNMLSQISHDFTIGINYVPGDRVTDEQLELALSTQLLEDRLIIDGNIGVTGSNESTQQTSSIVGDVTIEYKLTPDGRFRVKAFNRSNDLSLYTDYAPYTQGVSIFYRKEFNHVKELFGRSREQK
ncbi:MAG: translocation/assembly module TamB domain-containing protein [Bacteroidales bacterium]